MQMYPASDLLLHANVPHFKERCNKDEQVEQKQNGSLQQQRFIR